MVVSPAKKEFTYSTADFEAVRKKLKKLTGINLADSKDSMVYSRLARRIRVLKLGSFLQYLTYLDNNAPEQEEFVNALTTNLTSFFRESHHFDALEAHLKKNPKATKIWCAASSTGEEPYSIAMTAVKAFGKFSCPVQIIASDIDSKVLQTAREGMYRSDQIRDLPIEMKRQFFHRGTGNHDGKVRVVKELRELVQFQKLNLMDDSYAIPKNIDIVFCRNVMIYFDKPTQLDILQKIVKHMAHDSLYIAGHSENFGHVSQVLTPLGKTIYKPKRG
ncbi:chemotaxis protein CheR [Glaciecola sp. MH2013]|uniref:CheR family methyltransferase n=1 Tax=Glaciecola sp. MH2013 TaxID=2785524 RepID=UPI00189E556C|nr:CheR family methyltransferase [Glaciecola sp. MH2013]MBF7074327.1 chemotaxis protein CheR [Glaciecola sp. MH2013]